MTSDLRPVTTEERHWIWTFKPCGHIQYETRSPHAYDYCSTCKKWLQTVGQEVSR